MKKLWIAATALAVVVAALWIRGDREKGTAEEPESPPALANRPVAEASPPHDATTRKLDPARLFDRGYELDPAVQAIARELGVPAACIIAVAKYQLHQIPSDEGVCPKLDVGQDAPTIASEQYPDYEQYSDAELRSLATSEPAAAVTLARRTESDAEARQWYERAVALSDIAQPLIEWMTFRDTGGLLYWNGELDLEAAKEGYKIHLIAAAIDGRADPIIDTYQAELRGEGVDLGQLEMDAAQEVERLKRKRHELTGGERP